MTNILYIHGFNGKTTGSTATAIREFASRIPDSEVFAYQYTELHKNVEKTQKEIAEHCEKHNINLIVATSLGAFYSLHYQKNIRKIVINPCMQPSIEIPYLTKGSAIDNGAKVNFEKVIENWKFLEEYKDVPDEKKKNTFGIFGKQDDLFHYDENHTFKPLFDKVLGNSEKANSVFVEGKHSIGKEGLEPGFFAALDYFGINHN